MCQATIYLDGEEIMKDVISVEALPEGIRLSAFFEQPRLVPATIRKIDLMKNKIVLESSEKREASNE
ncbi:MAG: CooT family nickel-binding protein [Chloroflexota bacterium]|nr:CooT family nickel-binding protein [Chloroflexota bacterium]